MAQIDKELSILRDIANGKDAIYGYRKKAQIGLIRKGLITIDKVNRQMVLTDMGKKILNDSSAKICMDSESSSAAIDPNRLKDDTYV